MIVKPAMSTVRYRGRSTYDAGIRMLPEGSLQRLRLCPRPVDHLDYRDHVAFTGSLATANTLRSHESVLNGGCASPPKQTRSTPQLGPTLQKAPKNLMPSSKPCSWR